jgi:hypothetical protein
MLVYLVSNIFIVIIKISNCSIIVWNPRIVRPSLVDILQPSMQTLKHIVVKISGVVNIDDDPLFGIPSDFEEMHTKNIIETITIEIFFKFQMHAHRGDGWGRLDEVLSTSGWFSLKRVSLAINIYDYSQREALRKSLETQFPRLSSSNSVSFIFKIDDQVNLAF